MNLKNPDWKYYPSWISTAPGYMAWRMTEYRKRMEESQAPTQKTFVEPYTFKPVEPSCSLTPHFSWAP